MRTPMIQLKNDRFSLLLTADMRRKASAQAKEGEVSLGEWIRRAMLAALKARRDPAAAEHPKLCDCSECVPEAEWA